MIHIYTGTGKGKTTLALGLALRALGHKKRVLMIQFMKKDKGLGELKAAQRFKRFKILQAGRAGWVKEGTPDKKDQELAQAGLIRAQKAIKDNKIDLLILDELNLALDFGLLKAREVITMLKDIPQTKEVVITGRGIHPETFKIADLVSEIRELKHYYQKGITARAGIEY